MGRWIVVAVLLLGCGDDGAPGSDASATSQTFTCESGDVTFPALDKSCEVASDCVLAIHVTDCCGNTIAVGIHAGGQQDFFDAEQQCAEMFLACGCPAGPSVAEDGNTGSPQLISVECSDNLCRSYVVGSQAQ